MPLTPLMNLQLPDVGVTPGPAWATQLNDAFDTVDSHDHSPGKGVQVTPSGLNINSALNMSSQNLINARALRMSILPSPLFGPAEAAQLFVVDNGPLGNGDLYYNNGSGVNIRITSGSGLNASVLGGFGGDYVSFGAEASFVASTLSYEFRNSPGGAFSTIRGLDYFGRDLTFTGAGSFSGNLGCVDLNATGNVSCVGATLSGGDLNASSSDCFLANIEISSNNILGAISVSTDGLPTLTLDAATTVIVANANLEPSTDSTQNLGSDLLPWSTVHTDSASFKGRVVSAPIGHLDQTNLISHWGRINFVGNLLNGYNVTSSSFIPGPDVYEIILTTPGSTTAPIFVTLNELTALPNTLATVTAWWVNPTTIRVAVVDPNTGNDTTRTFAMMVVGG